LSDVPTCPSLTFLKALTLRVPLEIVPPMSVQQRLQSLGITLPPATNPAANYANYVITGNLLFVAGKGPLPVDGKLPKGKLGREFSTEQGYVFARSAGFDILAVLQLALGDLERVARVVKLQGFVNATPEFEQHPQVLDGCSDLMASVFGPKGVHARSVFGAASVRGNLPIIVDSIFEIVL
jgi:enamine deaminase RidA (YjgF/YER057c/UK114 family)